ncbi:hypothetical protein [Shewanella gelidii]|uniref:DUF3718 domain-containing protein n=1 Tax=Shewanella gelidii TaxID=1642821 RepID=A0A917JTK7_9GAMM|nr:hypothetical protein [Shewanella gelidii]MCL1098319.1 hypothetical protein [Shewanella gelidii]GGI84349.1 hypothetical protein GCM10009332_21990 [Shewanella gelidii]
MKNVKSFAFSLGIIIFTSVSAFSVGNHYGSMTSCELSDDQSIMTMLARSIVLANFTEIEMKEKCGEGFVERL